MIALLNFFSLTFVVVNEVSVDLPYKIDKFCGEKHRYFSVFSLSICNFAVVVCFVNPFCDFFSDYIEEAYVEVNDHPALLVE